eukprot:TRINITY_DN7364_c0_g1_i1.p1 TRINITY_DN7364_c0_g1~~TRINITY_DN7364_c0_g1_i1.p1  ORF type:complete len:621 (+),score=136.55 TRINITY_DN7364_c0_g1_i1:165-1865(+)
MGFDQRMYEQTYYSQQREGAFTPTGTNFINQGNYGAPYYYPDSSGNNTGNMNPSSPGGMSSNFVPGIIYKDSNQPILSGNIGDVPVFDSQRTGEATFSDGRSIEDVQMELNVTNTQLNQLQDVIKTSSVPIPMQSLEYFHHVRTQLEESLKLISKSLEFLMYNHILDPVDLFEVRELKSRTFVAEARLDLYHLEIISLSAEFTYNTFPGGHLCIIEEPAPQPIKKDQKLDTIGYKIKFIEGARTPVQLSSPVRAVLVTDDGIVLKNQEMIVQQEKDIVDGQVYYDTIKWKLGSQNRPVVVAFQVNVSVQLPDGSVFHKCIQSRNVSNQTIVYTNARQWSNAQQNLILKWLFDVNATATFFQFCNYIQLLFIQHIYDRDTNYAKIDDEDWRPLSQQDFQYLRKSIGRVGSKTVNQTEFSLFWDWFGPVVKSLRSSPYLKEMWKKRLVWGMIDKETCINLLTNLPIGSFIIRFSKREPGNLAIAYKVTPGTDGVRHFLVRKPRYPNILDYLQQNQNILLQFVLAPLRNNDVIRTVSVSEVLESMISPKKRVRREQSDGYDEEMVASYH